VRSDGTVVAWGLDDLGQTDVPSGLSNVIAVAASAGHSLALKSGGKVAAWGGSGGSNGKNDIPAGLTSVIGIADGLDHSLAIVASPPQLLLSNPHWQNGVFIVS